MTKKPCFTKKEIDRFYELYMSSRPITMQQIADILNMEFHSGKSIRDEQSCLDAMDADIEQRR